MLRVKSFSWTRSVGKSTFYLGVYELYDSKVGDVLKCAPEWLKMQRLNLIGDEFFKVLIIVAEFLLLTKSARG